ncbi:MAG: hypothetical protein LBC70_03270 [Chitinispirillales bacterium]|nr:hypothetical protein [Chitinispirillales bacterium]
MSYAEPRFSSMSDKERYELRESDPIEYERLLLEHINDGFAWNFERVLRAGELDRTLKEAMQRIK